jgi:PilZ domain
MSIQQVPFARRGDSPISRIVSDRRRHRRIDITLLGRFMRENRQEYPCKLHDISVGGASIHSPVDLDMGERVIAIFDQIASIEGTVCRLYPGGFAITLAATQHKREKLAAQLTWMINRHEFNGLEAREHERIPVMSKTQNLTLAEGLVITCEIQDVSMSGAAIITPARPSLGMEVKLGNLRATVVRHHDQGIGLKFSDVQSQNALRRYFG